MTRPRVEHVCAFCQWCRQPTARGNLASRRGNLAEALLTLTAAGSESSWIQASWPASRDSMAGGEFARHSCP